MKLLVLTSRFPYPLEKGDKLRIYYQLRELAKTHEIVLCALTEEEPTTENFNVIQSFCSKIYLLHRSKLTIYKNIIFPFFNGLPVQVGYFFDKKLKVKFEKIVASEQPDHIYCPLIRTANYVKDIKTPKTIDYMLQHEQAYRKALDFIANPPDDVEIVQIFASATMQSKLLGSTDVELKHDYRLGQQAGHAFLEEQTFLPVQTYNQLMPCAHPAVIDSTVRHTPMENISLPIACNQ